MQAIWEDEYDEKEKMDEEEREEVEEESIALVIERQAE